MTERTNMRDNLQMALFEELDRLLSSQGDRHVKPNEFFASLGAPSVSVAVLDHGEIEARCYSTMNDGVDTRFQACSISKPVTAMAVMRLVDQGRLKLEDKISGLLPDMVVENLGPSALVQEITIGHILSHTAGLTASAFRGYTEEYHPTAIEVVIGKEPVNSVPVRVVGVPGRQYSYSGGGYTLLQIALENLTLQPFPQLMEELVLQPLEMKDSSYVISGNQHKLAIATQNGTTTTPHWHYFPELAAAGLWTTPRDLCKVLRAVQNSLKGGEGSFLKPGTAKIMLNEVDSNSMALGWVAPKDPGTYFGHTGSNDPGFRCVAMGISGLTGEGNELPNEGCGIVVMTNSTEGIVPAFTALQTISYIKQWPESHTLSQNMKFVTAVSLLDTEVRGDWKIWQGKWAKESDEWTIEAGDDGQPQAFWRNRSPVKLLPAAICSEYTAEGQSINLLLKGMAAMMRFTWNDGKPSVDYMDGLTFGITRLSKAE